MGWKHVYERWSKDELTSWLGCLESAVRLKHVEERKLREACGRRRQFVRTQLRIGLRMMWSMVVTKLEMIMLVEL